VLRALAIPGAWLGAALWAVHPVMVESVAWVSEMKNTQSGLFFLLAVLFFLKSSGEVAAGRRSFWLGVLFGALAMASKSSAVVLPGVLLLGAWWREGRFTWRQVTRVSALVPFALITVAVSSWTQALHRQNGDVLLVGQTWPERLATVGDNVWFYLGKLVWPRPLVVIYPQAPVAAGHALAYLPLLAAAALTGILWRWREAWARPYLFAWSYFLVALFPVLGLVPIDYFQWAWVADHFQYLAAMGPLALAGAGGAWIFRRAGSIAWPTAVAAATLLTLGVVTWQRAWVFEDRGAFWTDVLAKNPAFWTGYDNYGNALAAQGRFEEAIAQFRQAIRRAPTDAKGYVNIGSALFQEGQRAPAADYFRLALRYNPASADAHYDLGTIFLAEKQNAAAADEYRLAIKFRPEFAEAYANLGTIQAMDGDLGGAIVQFRQAVKLNPDCASCQFNLGVLLLKMGQAAEAVTHLQAADRLQPGNPRTQSNLAAALAARSALPP
jgi:tetratricopeptide (TPR) repeat protein